MLVVLRSSALSFSIGTLTRSWIELGIVINLRQTAMDE